MISLSRVAYEASSLVFNFKALKLKLNTKFQMRKRYNYGLVMS